MSDFDQELRRRLTDQAASVTPTTDLDDLVERIAADRSRGRRVSAMVLALVVIVGPIAGFAVARASSSSPGVATAGRKTPETAAAPRAQPFRPTPLPELKSDARLSQADSFAFSSNQAEVKTVDRTLLASGQPLTLGRMFARAAASGVELRVYGARLESLTPAAAQSACASDELVQVDASTAFVSGVSQASLLATPANHVFASVDVVGASEGAPVWVAIVSSDKGTTARATFVDGGSDSMRLDHGVAVVAHTVSAHVDRATIAQQLLHVEILDAHGTVVAQTSTSVDASATTCTAASPQP